MHGDERITKNRNETKVANKHQSSPGEQKSTYALYTSCCKSTNERKFIKITLYTNDRSKIIAKYPIFKIEHNKSKENCTFITRKNWVRVHSEMIVRWPTNTEYMDASNDVLFAEILSFHANYNVTTFWDNSGIPGTNSE